jgi:peptide/nickel transport system substrate-binding protein
MVGDSLTIMFLGMNPTYAPWENKNLRKAVAYAIDRDSIIKNIILGYADRLDAPIGPGQYAYDPSFPQKYTYDPAKAREYMVQAGFPDGVDVEFTTTVGTYTKDKEISEAMLPMLAAVGIRAKLLTPEAATRTTMLFDGKLSLFYQGRGQVRDPGKPLSQYFETGVTKRLTYSNPQVDALFKQERAAFNPDERKKLLNQIMNQLVEDVPAHWLWRYKLLWGVSKSVDWKPRADEAIMANEIRVK